MNDAKEKMLQIDDYPQLSFISWNRVVREISEEDAFSLYERNWKWIYEELLQPHEVDLIERLTTKFRHSVRKV